MKQSQILISLILLAALALSGCGAPKPEPTPTLTTGQVQTAAVSTFAADLTQTAFYMPTATFTPSPQPTNTLSATFSVSTLPVAGTTAVSGVTSCNNLTFVSDVTIPDNTQVTPGQSFTKTWRVQNSGSCPWANGYKFSLVGGDAMGAQALTLTQSVAPGATFDLSVPMTAPATSGTITGNWRMSDAAGTFFGDVVYVTIVVGSGGAAATATPGGAATATTGTP